MGSLDRLMSREQDAVYYSAHGEPIDALHHINIRTQQGCGNEPLIGKKRQRTVWIEAFQLLKGREKQNQVSEPRKPDRQNFHGMINPE